VATFSYFLAIGYVVINASSYFSGEDVKDSIFNFLEGVLELIKSISRDQFAFFFAVIMNFALLYGIFALNMCSMYLVEIARALEQKRTGGRNANEVELGGYTGKKPARMELVDEEELKLNVDSSSRKKSVWGPPPSQLNET
jgi:hypothetical protein